MNGPSLASLVLLAACTSPAKAPTDPGTDLTDAPVETDVTDVEDTDTDTDADTGTPEIIPPPLWPSFEVIPYSEAMAGSMPTARDVNSAGVATGEIYFVHYRAWWATPSSELQFLPVPTEYPSSLAHAVEDGGTIVGTVSALPTTPYADGLPAYWLPDGNGGYTVHIPEQLEEAERPGYGTTPIVGGELVAVNESGTLIGWSRFEGAGDEGVPTRFFPNAPPQDLSLLGFTARPTGLSDDDIVVGDEQVLDLTTGIVTTITRPPTINGFNIDHITLRNANVKGQMVADAITTANTPRWMAVLYDPVIGWWTPDPDPPSEYRHVTDLNNHGDAVLGTYIWFAQEGYLSENLEGLMAPAFSGWDLGGPQAISDTRIVTLHGQLLGTGNYVAFALPVP